jgi:2-dehydropantoate 2-reductase
MAQGDTMKILCLGAGALGGYFGGWLAENGADVTFLVRPARKASLDRRGLSVESPIGALKRPVTTVTQDQITAPFDMVLLSAKAYDLDTAIAAIRPAIGPRSAVLPILNGIQHIDRLVTAFGRDRVLGGLAKIQATLGPDGTVVHMNDWNEIVFGELDGQLSDRVTSFAALFPKPQVKAQPVPDIQFQMWRKLVHLGTVAALTTLTRQALGALQSTPDGPKLIDSTLQSVADIAAAEGHPIPPVQLDEMRAMFRKAGATYKASMLRDMEKGGATEGAHILGYLAERADAHGIGNPIFRIAAANVAAYEATRSIKA